MATYNGSGKFVKIQSGSLSMGRDSTTYSRIKASSYYDSSKAWTHYGFTDSTMQFLDLPNLTELSLCGYKAYTGTINMYAALRCTKPPSLCDNWSEFISGVLVTRYAVEFVNGLAMSSTWERDY